MIDESPVALRSSYEHGVLMEYLKKVGQRRKKHRFEEFTKKMDKEQSKSEAALAYDCSLDDILSQLNVSMDDLKQQGVSPIKSLNSMKEGARPHMATNPKSSQRGLT